MSSIKPIDKRLLIDSITIDDKEYNFVRIEKRMVYNNQSFGNDLTSNYLLIIDKVNTPDYEEIKKQIVNDLVIVSDGIYMKVINYEILKGYTEHHMEVWLV